MVITDIPFDTPDGTRRETAAVTNNIFINAWGHKGSDEYSLFPKMKELSREENECNSEVIFDKQYVTASMPNHGMKQWVPIAQEVLDTNP